jgi:choline dehydrogenase
VSHDYVIVGAGSSGCVLARRLSDDPKVKVVLLEAGPPSHRTLKVRAPAMYQQLWRGKLDWNLYTAPQQRVAQRKMYWPRGRVLGGTSCLNSMVYIRGHRDNYDEWAALGCTGWGWDDVLPYFKRSEDNTRGESAHHGAGGPLGVCDQLDTNAVSDAFAEAVAARCGVKVIEDFNTGEHEGAGRYQQTIRGRERASTAREFLDPVRGRANLEIVCSAHALGVVVEKGRATGVRVSIRGQEQTFRAAKEVIVCGGAIGSPHLLMLSGIGPAAELREAGVDVVHDSPSVGKHLADHLLSGIVFQTESPHISSQAMHRMLGFLAKYLVGNRGVLGKSPVETGAFVKSTPSQPRPDIQFHFVPWGFPPNTDLPHAVPKGKQIAFAPGLIYPRSLGEIRLASKDPMAAPLIDPRYFSDDADLALLVTGLKLSREIAATAPLAQHVGRELHPGPEHTSDEALRAKVCEMVNTIFHPVGTCRMGRGDDAVVDPSLRVRGVDGLRVADAAIMPRIVGGNTNAPCIMIGEKAADLIRASA